MVVYYNPYCRKTSEKAGSMATTASENNDWVGKTVTISGCGGCIYVEPDLTKVKTKHGRASPFFIERVNDGTGQQDTVAFRLGGTNKYLTLVMYRDEQRQLILESLAQSAKKLLPEHLPRIVDYVMARPTSEDNFEGAGFCYAPMTAQPGPPNVLQKFIIEQVPRRRVNYCGIKSLYGTYWRSQHWDKTVSQSPHLLGDETWFLNDQQGG